MLPVIDAEPINGLPSARALRTFALYVHLCAVRLDLCAFHLRVASGCATTVNCVSELSVRIDRATMTPIAHPVPRSEEDGILEGFICFLQHEQIFEKNGADRLLS